MRKDQPKTKNRGIVWLLLSLPIVIFREWIEAALAILLVVLALAIAVGAWHYFPNYWYWIAVPLIALLAVGAYPLLKFADKIEAEFDRDV